MKIAAVSGIKNEADIIESFVRHNAKFIDDFYFVDDSSDGTGKILELLAAEGFNIYKLTPDTRDYSQTKVNTAVTHFINKDGKYDWIFYLDGDEILYSPNKKVFLDGINKAPNMMVGNVRALDFTPNGRNYFESKNPLKDCFVQVRERNPVQKIFIRGSISNQVIILPGQHGATNLNGNVWPSFESDVALAHFPRRSPEQFSTRVILGYSNLVAKRDKIANEGSHVYEQFRELKKNEFSDNPDAYKTLENNPPIYLEDIILKYLEYAQKNPVKELALELERVAKLLHEFRTKSHQAIEHAEGILKMKDLF